jgi:hypothetical protein
VCLIKIEDQKCSEQDRNHWSRTSPAIGQKFMDDILHLFKAYKVVEVQLHLLLTLALDEDMMSA